MGCRNCDEKESRYKTVTKVNPETGARVTEYEQQPPKGDIDRSQPAPGFTTEPSAQDRYQAFEQVKTMSYKELCSARAKKNEFMNLQAEHALKGMTDAMRQTHVEQLVAIVNCEEVNPMGMVPGAAVRVLNKLLEREDFSFILTIYPNLKDTIDALFADVVLHSIKLG